MVSVKKVVIITDAPSPYRVAHYRFLQSTHKEYDFHIIFAVRKSKSDLRRWDSSTEDLRNFEYLPCYRYIRKGRYDNRQIFITYGVGAALSRIKPDVVVCMEYNPTSIQAMAWCKLHRVPYVSLTDGTLHSERNIGRLQKLSRQFIMKNARLFIASSTKAKEKIESYHTGKPIYVSLLTVDISKYLVQKHTASSKTLIYVGSLIERKGIDLLLRAMTCMKTDCELKIVGAGGLEEEYKQLAKDLGIGQRVYFLGYQQREALVKLYQDADVFVLPTREDCYGLVILEAMCASLPVVSSKYADGAYDLIDDGNTGSIVDPYDIEAFAQAMDEMLAANSGQNKIGVAAYQKALQFSFDKVSVSFMAAVDMALAENKSKVRK